MSKFLQLYNMIMEDINSTRKPIQKVNAMSPKEFIAFLKEFLPYVKNGKVDLNDIIITEKFGSFGGVVVFEIFKIENDKLTRFNDEDEKTIMEMIQDMNNDEFSFYLSQDIILNQNVNFTLDPNELLSIINSPEFNKERFDKKKDAKLIEEIQKIQNNVVKQLSNIVDQSKGAFSAEGDLIEGIVLKINSSGNQYGIFSDGYKNMKHSYWEKFENVKPLYMEFLKKVFGYSQLRYIKLHWNEIDKKQAQKTLDSIKDEYVKKIETLINDINESKIPSSVKNTQISMATKTLNKIKELKSIEKFGSDLNE